MSISRTLNDHWEPWSVHSRHIVNKTVSEDSGQLSTADTVAEVTLVQIWKTNLG